MQNLTDITEYCRAMTREDDPERYYVSLFAPASAQPHLWALFAFNQEVAKTRESVSEPMIGEIRLQWWREALEGITAGTPREHLVVLGLNAIPNFSTIRPLLDTVIDGRARDLEMEVETGISTLEGYADMVGGALHEAAARIIVNDLNETDAELVRASGRAWAMLGVLRALPYQIADTKAFSVTGATTQGLTGRSAQELEEQLEPLLTPAKTYVDREIMYASGKPTDKSVRPMLAINALTRRHLKALKRAGGSPFRMADHEDGNLRKLVALAAYHIF
ncbi:phytoene/squalene synthase family protein [Kordiimonas gwangyangensis]|uniref:phytoene/squalene synthase family protein n=1 Tax=Kordiimonas gwangyangensis TaxID=288022 RepID=UPI00035C9544|nr:squalene/phytoene synthase family protein [Kordiimonas gwangyangensis]